MRNAIRGAAREETQRLDERMDGLGKRVDSLDKKIDTVDTGLRAVMENNMDEIRKLLKEDYGCMAQGVVETGESPQVRATVEEHGAALKQHNQRIESLENKAI